MPCDASWLANARAPAATSSALRPCKRARSSQKPAASCCARSRSRPRRWYDSDRRSRIWFSPVEPVRHWVEAEGPISPTDSREDRIVLLSYNILGDHNAFNHRDLYYNVPHEVLCWDSRKKLICKEIIKWNADLVCLQEVDRYHDILSIMRREGYAGNYKRRTGEAKDGCAVLWKEKRVRLVEEESIEFAAFGLRDNVAQVFVFEVCEVDSRKIVVGNIHVLFNPKRGDIKLGQVRMLLQKAHALSEKWGNIPIVLAGDFNSTPQGAIYEFLSTSELNLTALDRRELSGQERNHSAIFELPRLLNFGWTHEELRNATGTSECTVLKHPLKLCSSYASVKGSNALTRAPNGEPLATTYHSKFLGTVDYLWYTSGLASTRVLDTLPIGTLRRIGGLPSKDIGSDHLALVSEFVFTESQRIRGRRPTKTQATRYFKHLKEQ